MRTISSYVELAPVREHWTGGLLVLMYHAIDVPPLFHPLRGLYVTPQRLGRHLEELRNSDGACLTTLSEWNGQRGPQRSVALTFDDAYLSLYTKGMPVLRSAGARGLVYVVASLIGKTNVWDRGKGAREERLMELSHLQDWLAEGHEVGSHTLSHPDLTQLPAQEARQEIVDSKKRLEDVLGRPVKHFCYPYGRGNRVIRDMVEEAGYETATTVVPEINTAESDALTLGRLLATHRRPWLAALLRR